MFNIFYTIFVAIAAIFIIYKTCGFIKTIKFWDIESIAIVICCILALIFLSSLIYCLWAF